MWRAGREEGRLRMSRKDLLTKKECSVLGGREEASNLLRGARLLQKGVLQ